MKIALTYDLKETYLQRGFSPEAAAEFDSRETIDALAAQLAGLGHSVERWGSLPEFLPKLLAGQRPDLVFNICEGHQALSREAQVPSVLDAFGIPYTFSSAEVLGLTLHKGWTKHLVRGLGVKTAAFTVLQDLDDLAGFVSVPQPELTYPLFVKPVADGTSKGISVSSRVFDAEALAQQAKALLATYQQPVLVETYLPGREWTVGLVGTGRRARVIGAMEICFKDPAASGIYSYAAKFIQNEAWIDYRKADPEHEQLLAEQALKIWRGLNCRDAGRIDFRMDDQGHLNFLEINPLAGLNPDYGDLPIIGRLSGYDYARLISDILESAALRLKDLR